MRRTNSKAVKEAVRKYLADEVALQLAEREIATEKPYTCYLDIVRAEKASDRYNSEFEMFKDWASGLGGYALGADIYCHWSGEYCRTVQKILQNWLDETDEEAQKYDVEKCEELMTRLCYRELKYLADHE